MSAAIGDVVAERIRQIMQEGYLPEVNDKKDASQLAGGAVAYILGDRSWWPFEESQLKLTGRRRNLVKAAAMLIAEIERLDRMAINELQRPIDDE